MIKLVAFDWNGTILADTVACMVGDDAALRSLNKKPIGLKKFREIFEIPLTIFYARAGVTALSKENLEKCETVFHKVYEDRAANSRTRAGARDLLIWLDKNKVPAIIFSNHIKKRIYGHLDRLKITKYFQEVIGNSLTGEIILARGKGKKLQDYLKANKIKPQEVLVVGDTTEEIEIARELGAIVVAITDGYNSTSRLKAAKPDYLLGDLRQIEKIIKNENS